MAAALMKGVGSMQPKAFAAFVADDETRTTVMEAAADAGVADPHIAVAKIDDVLRRLQKISTPKMLVVDLSGVADIMAEVMRLAEVCDEGTHVIIIGDVNDIETYRKLISFGVQDYFAKPLSAEVLVAGLTKCGKPEGTEEAAANQIGDVIGIIGARGGVGATSVGVNLAWSLSNQGNRKVALVDLDLFFGSCGLALDLDLGRGFREALENPSRIDSLFIERAMIKANDNLFVLSAEEALDTMIHFDGSAIELLIDHLRRDFQCVVVDLPRFAARTQAAILTPPSTLMVVSDPSLAGMRDTLRLTQLLKKVAPKTDLQVILNKVGAHASSELAKADFEKGAETKVSAVIPYDVKSFGVCASTGKPLAKAAAKGRAEKAISGIAGGLAKARMGGGKKGGRQAVSFLDRMMGRAARA
ncbi:MAG: P-loop NTPase [Hyphomicrobiales bacterium]|nr:P-loop NTPase [Hyphomicrobiales bacterium]